MPAYLKGKVYCIRSPYTESIYIGSTTQSLAKRMGQHRDAFKKWKVGKTRFVTCFQIMELGDAYIELIENYSCKNREELDRREGEWMRQKENCINHFIAGRTSKEYYEENKETKNLQHREYYKANRNILLTKQKQYNEHNKEIISEKKRLYYLSKINKSPENIFRTSYIYKILL